MKAPVHTLHTLLTRHAPPAGAEAAQEPEYLVKWTGKAHCHNEWVPEGVLGRLAKRKLANFKRRHGNAPCCLAEPAWGVPQRLIARRPSPSGPGWEVLVKWAGLGYEHTTWEVRMTCLLVPSARSC